MEQARPLMVDGEFMEDPYAVADQADALVIVAEWDAFRVLDLAVGGYAEGTRARGFAQRLSTGGRRARISALYGYRQGQHEYYPRRVTAVPGAGMVRQSVPIREFARSE
jgi:hypothetical protein